MNGKIKLVNPDRCGAIEGESGEVLYFRGACVVHGYAPRVGDWISFRVEPRSAQSLTGCVASEAAVATSAFASCGQCACERYVKYVPLPDLSRCSNVRGQNCFAVGTRVTSRPRSEYS
jgi:hypothetical protein